MGTTEALLLCKDCFEKNKEQLGEEFSNRAREVSEFRMKVQHMNKEEFVEHAKNTSCPDCGSDNWKVTDMVENH